MLGNKMSLSAVVQALSLAATDANERIHKEYINTVKRARENGKDTLMLLSPPLSISNVSVSFSAHVSKAERNAYKESGGDLMLDFNKSGEGNFKGEIRLKPYEPESLADFYPDNQETPDAGDGYMPACCQAPKAKSALNSSGSPNNPGRPPARIIGQQ